MSQPPSKRTKTDADRLAEVAHCMDNYLRQRNHILEAELSRLLRQNAEYQRGLNNLRRVATGTIVRSNELQTMLDTQLQMNEELHAYAQRLEERLRDYEPDFQPEFEVIDLTAESEVDSDATILEEDELDRDM